MKQILPLFAFALFISALAPHAPAAEGRNACQAKEESILKELEFARRQDNAPQVRGLEKALANVRAWCNQRDLLADAEKKVREKRQKVEERTEELRESQAEGDKDLPKRRRKLEEAKSELEEAIAERDALR